MTWTLIAAVLAAAAPDAGVQTPSPDAGTASPVVEPAYRAPPPAATDRGDGGQPAAAPQIVYVPVPQAPAKEPEERDRHFFVNLEAGGGRIDLSSVAQDGSVVVSRTVGVYGGLNVGVRFLRFLAVVLEGRLGHYFGAQTFDTVLALAKLRAQASLGAVKLFGEIGGGFAYAGNFQGCTIGGNCPVASSGYSLHVGAGIDIALGEVIWIGGAVLADTINSGPFGIAGATTSMLTRPGDSAALQLSGVGRVTLNF